MDIYKIFNIILYGISLVLVTVSAASKVIELSDRFLELRGESTWIITFYAPWCGHCKKLEPVWNHAAQALYNTEIRVGRVDCTRFTAMANEFKIKGFPTIMYVKGATHHVFRGDRTKEEIIGFALRMAGPPVPQIDSSVLIKKSEEHQLFFLYAGPRSLILWDCFYSNALEFRHFNYFYATEISNIQKLVEDATEPSIYVFKDTSYFQFPVTEEIADNVNLMNMTLATWINNERFPAFIKFTHGNMGQLWKVNKYLAIAVVNENKVGSLNSDKVEEIENHVDAYEFRDMVKDLILSQKSKYSPYFQFGWTGTPDLANSIAMEKLPLPSFIIVNTSSMVHYLPEQQPHEVNKEVLEIFLDAIIEKSAHELGGDTYLLRIYRMYYNSRTSLEEMWTGNPVLTSVLFGLPLGFLSLICYSIWCSDILDADEDDEEDQPSTKEKRHEKKE